MTGRFPFMFGGAKPDADPWPPPPPPYTGPKGPTVCAQRSHASGADMVFAPCRACGHLGAAHLNRPCDICQLVLRLDALEGGL